MNKRIAWIDVAKCFGIFFIYLGHLGDTAGLAYQWVFTFHVPLFFFLSGCLENYNTRGILDNARHKFISIVIPFFFFGILVIAIAAANGNTLAQVPAQLLLLLKGGVRNTLQLAGSLWFLTCLFGVEILFSMIKKLRFKLLIFSVCFALFVVSQLVIIPGAKQTPHWLWNLDGVCQYSIFYCIGWLLYQPCNRLLFSEKKRCKYLVLCIALVCGAFSARLFFGKNMLAAIFGLHPLLAVLGNIITPMLSILLVLVLSNYLSGKALLNEIGKNTLYLCGNEYIIKLLVPTVLSMLGLSLALTSPLQSYLYTIAILIAANFVLVRLERPCLDKLQAWLRPSNRQEAGSSGGSAA